MCLIPCYIITVVYRPAFIVNNADLFKVVGCGLAKMGEDLGSDGQAGTFIRYPREMFLCVFTGESENIRPTLLREAQGEKEFDHPRVASVLRD